MLFFVGGDQCQQIEGLGTRRKVETVAAGTISCEAHLLAATYEVGEPGGLCQGLAALDGDMLPEGVGIGYESPFVAPYGNAHTARVSRMDIRRHECGIDIFGNIRHTVACGGKLGVVQREVEPRATHDVQDAVVQ